MLFYLLHADNRHVLEKLLVELDDRLTPLTDADTVYSWTEVNGLPYLNACLKETHRMAGVCVLLLLLFRSVSSCPCTAST